MARPERPTVAIIGGGFSGAATAVHLLREAPPEGLEVVLINQSGSMARGMAYGTNSERHVLNVPAGAMSALPDDPEHFIRYCRRHGRSTSPGDFVPRSVYGSYLGDLLDEAERNASPRSRLVRRIDVAVGLSWCDRAAAGLLEMAHGDPIRADHIVLALGHFDPAEPAAIDNAIRASGRYVRDPWAQGALERVGAGQNVAVLGSGLTALDVALALHQRGHRGEIWCLSRRGLAPLPHRVHATTGKWSIGPDRLACLKVGARQALRAVRAEVAEAHRRAIDWRDVIASLRGHTAAIWHAWPERERRSFLRHVQPYWDVHRHRCAPQAGHIWEELRASGQLSAQAGRLIRVNLEGSGLVLRWQPRGGETEHTRSDDWLVNCTRPDSRIVRSRSPLVANLAGQGLLCADTLGIGVKLSMQGALLDSGGQASAVLSYVGPLAKARDWEATAVPELRTQAQNVARRVLHAVAAGSAEGLVGPHD
jgi:uncharacterized NAD(P)/FAD-binding protein YdhS